MELYNNKLRLLWSSVGPLIFKEMYQELEPYTCGHTIGTVMIISLYLPSCLCVHLDL